jgi:hypothetical protein
MDLETWICHFLTAVTGHGYISWPEETWHSAAPWPRQPAPVRIITGKDAGTYVFSYQTASIWEFSGVRKEGEIYSAESDF